MTDHELRRANVLVVGAGLAGLSTAYHLEEKGFADYLLVEAEDRPGGWAKTDWTGPYGADRAVHVLYFRDRPMRSWVAKLLSGRLLTHGKECVVDSGGIRTPYPFHANLHGRPPEVVKECLAGMWTASLERQREKRPTTFSDWIALYFGAGVARHFMDGFNTKMWTIPPEEMSCDWISDYIPMVDPVRILEGALTPRDSLLGLNSEFDYPRLGISELAESIARTLKRPILHRTRLEGLNPRTRVARFSGGLEVRYRSLISTIPLKALSMMVDELPPEAREARDRLEALDLVLIDVGFVRKEPSTIHWVYFPDEDVLAYRLHQCDALSRELCPAGEGLYCLEIAHSRARPLTVTDLRGRVTDDLIRTGWLQSEGQVTFYRERRFRCAYALPRLGWGDDAAVLRRWLNGHGIESIGRYGAWKYSNMEDALRDGRSAAQKILSEVPSESASFPKFRRLREPSVESSARERSPSDPG